MSDTKEPLQTSSTDTDSPQLPTCRCGFDRHHYRVSRNGQYTMMGWILLTCGISVEPIKVEWQCRICNETFDSSTEPADLARRS